VTAASIRQDRKPATGGYTRLERTVLQALTWELRDVVPDLAAQIAASRLTLRRNSGFGFFTEMAVGHPLTATSAPTRHLGTVHAMVAGLPKPVAFQLRVRDGRLLGLLADSYGQDTRLIDFTNTPFDQIFILDQGRSVELRQFASGSPDPTPAPSRQSKPIRREPQSGTMPVMTPKPIQPPRPVAVPLSEPPAPMDDMTLRIGLWALIGVAALLALGVGIPIPIIAIVGFLAVRYVSSEKGLGILRKIQEGWQSAREDQQRQAGAPT
jgi:hypothetical protein